MTVKKWAERALGGLMESEAGEWVHEADYDALAARLAEAEALMRDRRVKAFVSSDSASAPTPPPMDLSAAKEAARLHAQCPLCKSVNIVEMCDDCEHCWERGENMVADQPTACATCNGKGYVPRNNPLHPFTDKRCPDCGDDQRTPT